MLKETAVKAIDVVGEVEMSRRSFIKLGILSAFVASTEITRVAEKIEELTKSEPSMLDKIMDFLNFNWLDKITVKEFLFDCKIRRVIWILKKIESFTGVEI